MGLESAEAKPQRRFGFPRQNQRNAAATSAAGFPGGASSGHPNDALRQVLFIWHENPWFASGRDVVVSCPQVRDEIRRLQARGWLVAKR